MSKTDGHLVSRTPHVKLHSSTTTRPWPETRGQRQMAICSRENPGGAEAKVIRNPDMQIKPRSVLIGLVNTEAPVVLSTARISGGPAPCREPGLGAGLSPRHRPTVLEGPATSRPNPVTLAARGTSGDHWRANTGKHW